MNRRDFVKRLSMAVAAVGMLPLAAFNVKAQDADTSDDQPYSLPRDLDIFTMQGQSIFQVYGASGGLSAESVFYLIDESRSLVLPVRGKFRNEIPASALKQAVAAFREKAHYVDFDGGDLGLDGLDLR